VYSLEIGDEFAAKTRDQRDEISLAAFATVLNAPLASIFHFPVRNAG